MWILSRKTIKHFKKKEHCFTCLSNVTFLSFFTWQQVKSNLCVRQESTAGDCMQQSHFFWKPKETVMSDDGSKETKKEKEKKKKKLTGWGLLGSPPPPDLAWPSVDLPGDPGLPPVFFSSLALLNMTVKPSADAGSFTSHSPNLGKGRPLSCWNQRNKIKISKINA